MIDAIDAAAGRLLGRLLRRTGLEPDQQPDLASWNEFLNGASALLADLERDRYLLERSLDASSVEMLDLNAELRSSADRLAAEREELRHANSLLSATLESTSDGILVVDDQGVIRGCNGRFAELWGLPDEILESGTDERALEFVLSKLKEPESFLSRVRDLYDTPEASSHDVLEFVDGRVIERESLPQRIGGEIVGRVWSFRDITEQQRLQRELAHQAFHDPLTGLANRALFADHVEQAPASPSSARRRRRGRCHRPGRVQDRQRQSRPRDRRRAVDQDRRAVPRGTA